MAKSANIGSMSVTVRADTNPFTRALRQAQQTLGKFGKQLEGFAAPLKFFGGALASISFTHIIKDGIELADSLGDASARIGIAANKLLALQDVAGQADVSIEQLRVSLQKMTANIAGYSSDATKALTDMGLSIDKLSGMSAEEQLLAIADAMAQLRTEGQRTAAAMRVFGRSGANMTLIMQDGAAALRAQMEAMGAGPSAGGIGAADRTNDALTRGRQLWDRFKIFLGVNASRVAVGTMDNMSLTRRRRDEAIQGLRGLGAFLELPSTASGRALPRPRASNAMSALGTIGSRLINGGGRRTAFNQMFGNLSQLGGAGLRGIAGARGGMQSLRGRMAALAMGFGLNPDMVNRGGGGGLGGSASVSDIFGPLRAMLGIRGAFSSAGGLLGRASNGLFGMLRRGGNPAIPATGSIGAVDANSREGFAQRVRAMRDDPLLKIQRDALRELKGIHKGVMAFGGMEAANF